jgi:hypothetical protein
MAMPDNINISEQLRDQRKEYVRFRERAALISRQSPNSDLGAAMAEHYKVLDAAIASIDVALELTPSMSQLYISNDNESDVQRCNGSRNNRTPITVGK